MKQRIYMGVYCGILVLFVALCVLTTIELVHSNILSRQINQLGGTSASSELQKVQSDLAGEKATNSKLQSQLNDLENKYQGLQDSYSALQNQVQKIQDMKMVKRGKVVFLTFDDGPSSYTPALLDTLRANNVNATFFVVGLNAQKMPDIVRREYAEGNMVGIHCWNHSYNVCYASPAAFMEDFNHARGFLTELLGVSPAVCRFPGGTNNTVSHDYGNPHFMQAVVPQIDALGVKHFDWNAYDGDAEKRPATEQQVIDSVIGQVTKLNVSVVLCHDIKPTTVTAMATIIPKLKSLGYTFGVLSPDIDVPQAEYRPS